MKVGTRGSQLALTQTKQTCQSIANITGEKFEVDIIKTKGDKIKDSQLYNMDSKGLFTKELDKAVLEEEVDFAVHSLKDVPTELDEDLTIAAIPLREKANDVFISNKNWEDLEEGSSLGSSSLRREAFCKYHEKGFKFKPLRGNVETRIKKVLDGEVDGTLMAEAGLIRLGLTKYIKTEFPVDYITPAAGQGAVAVISRKDSTEVNETLKKIDDYNSNKRVLAEKTVLYELGIGCQWPLGSYAKINSKSQLELYSILLNEDGEILHQTTQTSSLRTAKELGVKVGKELLEYL
ncbi:hydroxymethylbilane synthase [Methanobrevibacter boviskoreani]|jgi:hydroxymethylbilane synthase|uniref:hydroxymethylbilane synthase n=1 Tax=Methanobrevibacter boviskoreani TaxID=1348249 RepID=UPI0023A8876D|nr:hydroxymethylbilane synthase [Methanobrevibacter boviskoreani]MCI6775011.1 hydroxymethylbilane synthase [Methanobrevibacter boviskoreani]MDD6256034.1 hydroxymethylbilane synthase [Methanobrevibacter boviskoreani]MDY5614435.1 hydroxymethylbilane synthase [Methanobrevibacter boviskoreani]